MKVGGVSKQLAGLFDFNCVLHCEMSHAPCGDRQCVRVRVARSR